MLGQLPGKQGTPRNSTYPLFLWYVYASNDLSRSRTLCSSHAARLLEPTAKATSPVKATSPSLPRHQERGLFCIALRRRRRKRKTTVPRSHHVRWPMSGELPRLLVCTTCCWVQRNKVKSGTLAINPVRDCIKHWAAILKKGRDRFSLCKLALCLQVVT